MPFTGSKGLYWFTFALLCLMLTGQCPASSACWQAEPLSIGTDTAEASSDSIAQVTARTGEMRHIYNRTIRKADSVFNQRTDLLLARRLYYEAVLLEPDKHYPADQIVEIDKLLMYGKSSSLISRLSKEALLLGALSLFLLVVLLVFLLSVVRRKRARDRAGSQIQPVPEVNAPIESDLPSHSNQVIQFAEADLLSPEFSVRLRGELVLMNLTAEDPMSFLDRLSQPFTHAEQLGVFDEMVRKSIKVPDFTRWLKSYNETVAVFAIRMIRAWQQKDAYPALIRLLHHSNPEIREEVVRTLGTSADPAVYALLRERYESETPSGRKYIVRALAGFTHPGNIEFFQQLAESGDARDDFSRLLLELKTSGKPPLQA